jgi:glutamate/tyrosine decarboxylase-like PLP-dependent enzyme
MNPLATDSADVRAMGHRTVELLAQLLDPDRPPLRRAGAREMAARLPSGVPEKPHDFDALLARLEQDVLPFMSNSSHPGYMAFVPTCGTFPAALGDFIAAALSVYVGSWMEGPGPSRVELVVLDWFKEWIGYPSGAAGVLVPGGSAANLTALTCARETLQGPTDARAVLYVSDQGHASVARAIRVLGFRPGQTRVLQTDGEQRLRPETVARAIDADLAAGLRPLAVVAAAGATNTGAVDPLPELAEICRARGVWLHVDAAYGGFAALTERGRSALAGLELADSVTLDPHKWLYQPIECGCVLVREGELLRRAFEIEQDYLADAAGAAGEVNFGDLGLQLTRGFRALKVWLSVNLFGAAAFREAIDRALDLAELARTLIAADDRLETIAAGDLGITCFRRRVAGGEEEAAATNAALVAAYEASGMGLVLSTRVDGRFAVRLCILNHTTRAEDVEAAVAFFAGAPLDPEPRSNGARSPHMMDVGSGWLSSASD